MSMNQKYCILWSIIVLFVSSCTDDLSQYGYPIEVPPINCYWSYQDYYYSFYPFLYYDNSCYDLDINPIDWLCINTNLEDMISYMTGTYNNVELTFQPVGTTCNENTMNAPRLVVTGMSSHLNNNLISWYHTIDIEDNFLEYDMSLKIEDVYDETSSQIGTLLWKRVIPGSEMLPACNLNWKGYFIPTEGSRRIYEYNYFTYF